VTLFALRTPDDVLSIRFACSPVWETQLAVRTFVDRRARAHHEPWHRLVADRLTRLDLTPLFAVLPLHGVVPDFLAPPPRTARPRLRDQLAEIRATPPTQVAHELELCRETVETPRYRVVLDGFLADPAAARDLLAARLQQAWVELVGPFWARVKTLLDRDVDHRARTLAGHGLRRVLDELHPRIRWTARGLSCLDRTGRTVELDERGLVLMPSAYLWPKVAAIVDEPWQPTIVYPARGTAGLWRAPAPPPDALARLLGRTRALVLASLDEPLSTTALAALVELSPAGASRHLLALRDAGLVSATRHGHEVRYGRTDLGSALLHRSAPESTRRRIRVSGAGTAAPS
jgi:DNA-binding transcriptional ArsR family regulator